MNNSKKTRGRPTTVSDMKLKEMALDIKNKHRGQKLSYLLLERETGIGRQTWKRRIAQYIEEINKPLPNSSAELSGEQVYFPNIEEIFERHHNNKAKIINELHEFETLFRNLYQELQSLRQKNDELGQLQEVLKKQEQTLVQLKEQSAHYEMMYK